MAFVYDHVTIAYVVDGDTFDALIDLGFEITKKMRFRLYGINCPEKTGSTKEAGLAAMQRMIALVNNQTVRVESLKYDKYGRSVARVILPDGRDLSRVLIEQGHGVPYLDSVNPVPTRPDSK